MGAPRSWDGYVSFDYLEEGVDYRGFELAEEPDRVEPWRVPLGDDEEERVGRLVEENVLVAFHEHAGLFPAEIGRTPDYVREGRVATAFRGLAASTWDAVFDNLLDGICQIHSKNGWKWEDVLHDLGMRLCDLAHQDHVVPAGSVEEILSAHREGNVAWIPSVEGAAMIENELDRIEVLYGFGVRILGVTYSEANALGSGLKEPRDGGLTSFGRKAVERMNKVGMLVDCSHAGDRTTLDTVEVSEAPVVLTHIGARALWDSNRLAPDEVLVAVAESGGVIGIEAAPHTTLTEAHPQHGIESVMEHFEYVKELVGLEHVTIGADAVYGDHAGLHRVYAAGLSLEESKRSAGGAGAAPGPRYEEVPYVKGLENPTEVSHNVVRWLVREGYDDDAIAAVVGGNVLRVLREAWA